MRNLMFTILVMVLAVFYVNPPKAGADVYFDDNGTHTIDYAIWAPHEVYIRNYTTVEIVKGADIERNVLLYEHSTLRFYDGRIGIDLNAHEQSQVEMLGGEILTDLSAKDWANVSVHGGRIDRYVAARDNSEINIYGGWMRRNIWAGEDAHLNIYGGTFDGTIQAGRDGLVENSLVTIAGTNFNYDYGIVPDSAGILTGILASGEMLSNDFVVYEGSAILLIPEPATLLLFGLGAVMLREFRM